jgi:signal transduction histidine kinase
MLLHSREGSGEHRLVDVNALVEEGLNLAYHGARAEKQGFKINMERSFDPAAGQVDVYPQEITRALLNVISNGFYAATKRKEQGSEGYEPTLMVATGTGLGLSITYDIIVKQHSGSIDARTACSGLRLVRFNRRCLMRWPRLSPFPRPITSPEAPAAVSGHRAQ